MAVIPPTVGDILEIRYVCQFGAQISYNVRHFEVSAVNGLGVGFPKLAAEEGTLMSGLYKAVLGPDATYLGLGVRRLAPVPTGEFLDQTGTGPGTGLGETLPPMVAGLVTFKSDTPGRRGRGRMYVPFPQEDHNDDAGTPNAAYGALVDSLAVQFTLVHSWEDIPGDDVKANPIIWGRVTFVGTPITSYQIRDFWGRSSRRRVGSAGDVSPF